MARKQKLKVYRTPIGFHDAYVAAPSQKAALKAWGADVDLFARGVAEMIDDEKLSRAPMEEPGTVVRILRGSSAEHMAALLKDNPPGRKSPAPAEDDGPPPRRRTRSEAKRSTRRVTNEGSDEAPERHSPEPAPQPRPEARSKPRPSRARLEKAEKDFEQAEAEHKEAIARIREQEKALQQKRRDLEMRHEGDIEKLEAAITKARESYGAALEKWRT